MTGRESNSGRKAPVSPMFRGEGNVRRKLQDDHSRMNIRTNGVIKLTNPPIHFPRISEVRLTLLERERPSVRDSFSPVIMSMRKVGAERHDNLYHEQRIRIGEQPEQGIDRLLLAADLYLPSECDAV